jgi:cell division protein FtsN
MSDQQVREIHLGGTALVFLFMISVVLAVSIFLLGISVGRGVRDAAGELGMATDVTVAREIPPGEMPPPTVTTPEDRQYHDQLQEQSTPPAESAARPADPPAPVPDAAPPEPSTPVTARAAGAALAPRAGQKPVPETGWFVQVNAFRSRGNADVQAAELKGKGYAAVVYPDPNGSLFRVRIGPFVERVEADRIARRLQSEEGIRSSIQR